jgi:hypothetical protein
MNNIMFKPGMGIKIYKLLKRGFKTKENNGFFQGQLVQVLEMA